MAVYSSRTSFSRSRPALAAAAAAAAVGTQPKQTQTEVAFDRRVMVLFEAAKLTNKRRAVTQVYIYAAEY